MQSSLTLSMPDRFEQYQQTSTFKFDTLQSKMGYVLGLATQNILHKTGGPFSAAIFNIDTNQLVSSGVNRVMLQNCSVAHGQMMAIMLGQKALKTYDFSLKGKYQIVTSGKMCIMCLGGVIWSGVSEVVSSANPEDIMSITGFDEGPVPKQYNKELQKRGIKVIQKVLHKQGLDVLHLYVKNGGYIYNSSINTNAKDTSSQ